MRIFVPVFLAAAILTGCAGSGVQEPITPSSSVANAVADAGNRYVWGLWNVRISADRERVEVIPCRNADMHFNVLRLLEVTPCHTCLTIENIHPAGPNELQADVRLAHPFPGLIKYTGFDVRGIFIAQTDFTFPVSGREIGWGDTVPRMLNPDGYTPLFNPTEYPPTFPAALGYVPGKYATGGDLSATLNPFMAYRKDAPRRMFEAGSAETRTVQIYAPPGPIYFGYAVDACWEPVENVVDPLTDFPPEANCLEAYGISVAVASELLPHPGIMVPIDVTVYDHQGQSTIASVTMECPDLFSGELALGFSSIIGDDGYLFTGTLPNQLGAGIGEYPLLVRVRDTQSDPNLGQIDAWRIEKATVGPDRGWARTWGWTSVDRGYSVAADASGNLYVAGVFMDTVDFDPGPGIDNYISNGELDSFLSKFDSCGNFLWARTWGGTNSDRGYLVAIDASGNVYVIGDFTDTVDFDPGFGVDNHTSNGNLDAFLSKFDSNGGFLWARTWGGTGGDDGYSVAADASGSAYVTGNFEGAVDFDPGPGLDSRTSNGYFDAFLSKFDSSGNFLWAHTWGGSIEDSGHSVAADASGNVYVAGYAGSTVDFDPGPGVDNHTSNGDHDASLSKFDSGGMFLWARTWGATGPDVGYSVTADASANVYVAGYFESTVDFDSGPGVDDHTSNGFNDASLSEFDSDGDFIWARTWGGTNDDRGVSVIADASGNVCATGYFQDTADLDPGLDVDNHTSNGDYDVFLSKFDSDGGLIWARTWGATGPDIGYSIAADAWANEYVSGYFENTVDFDPGSGVDDHTSNGDHDAFLVKFLPDGNW